MCVTTTLCEKNGVTVIIIQVLSGCKQLVKIYARVKHLCNDVF